MKNLLALVLVVLPVCSFAELISFHCKSTEVPGIHKFDAAGIVTVDEYNKVEGVISLQIQKAQAPDSIQIFEEIKVEGSRLHFEDGRILSNSFEQLTLTSKDNYIKSLNLLLDAKVDIASHAFSIDNFLYRSNCVIDSVK